MTTRTTLDELAAQMRGRVIRPDDADYDEARSVWNGMIDRRPAAVARCQGTADVIAALEYAHSNQLPVTARGGGHGVAGKATCDDGLIIDFGDMDGVEVDHRNRTARVGPGATWGQVDRETQAFGLAVTGGADSRTGVAGLTLGGGVGWLARAHGLTIDSLRSAEVVLADGRVVTASEDDHPDLFWVLRGGGGNFGIVTSFQFRLHEVGPEVMTAQAFYPMSEAAQVLAGYRDFMKAAPDEVTCYAMFITVPSVDPFPEAEHGKTTLGLFACHAGELEDGERDLTPLTEMGDPTFSVVAPMPYIALQSTFDAGTPDGGRYYWKAAYVDDLSDELISTLVQRIHPLPGVYSSVAFEPMGGAIAKVDVSATAFAHRDARFGILVSPGWADAADDTAGMTWARSLFATISSHGSTGVYSNYMNRDEGDRVDEAWATNRARLLEIKAKYDPDGVFEGNAPITA